MRFIIELATGVIDGVNRDFDSSTDFVPGSTEVILNGQFEDADDVVEGWEETGPRTVKLNTAPLVGDIVQIGYRPL